MIILYNDNMNRHHPSYFCHQKLKFLWMKAMRMIRKKIEIGMKNLSFFISKHFSAGAGVMKTRMKFILQLIRLYIACSMMNKWIIWHAIIQKSCDISIKFNDHESNESTDQLFQ
jgi:hypothetical protein